MKKKAEHSVLMLTFILLVSIFIASDVLAQLKHQRYPSSQPPISMVPTVTSFKVISWLPYEYSSGSYKLYVNTENIATNNPTQLRLSGKSDFSDTNWRGYCQRLFCIVGKGTGPRTVYFQVKNNFGKSKVKTATFQIPSRKDFIIHAGWAKRHSQPLGFNFSITPKDITSRCEMDASHDYIELHSPKGLTGSRCDYTLFSGKSIKTGWVFKRFTASASCSSPNRGYSLIPPNEGSRQIRFKVHLWTNSNNACTWYLNKIVLEGPGDAHWKEAFN